ncbi:MAG: nucleoside-triphosphatase [Anaerolineae bacterium]
MPGQRGADAGPGRQIGLLTGPVGAGKTTVAERVVGLARRKGLLCGGLLAPAMTNRCGQKVGIWGADVESGERRILARTERNLGGPSVGAYSFDANALAWAVTVIERALAPAARRPYDLIVVDEIGKLELWHGTGLAPVLPKLAAGAGSRSLVLVRDSLLAELQARLAPAEQVVFAVDEENRGTLAPQILASLM